MIARTIACSVRGISGVPVHVEADLTAGLPSVTIVGLTDRSIQEARERVRAAIRNAGYEWPSRRLTVNLAPAEVPKEGTGFDLAIAIAVLRAGGCALDVRGVGLIGELGLDSTVRPVTGVLPMVRCLAAHGVAEVLVPVENAEEATLVDGIRVIAVASLQRAVDHLGGGGRIPATAAVAFTPAAVADDLLASVRGQMTARRALEIAAAGSHNLLMVGPPGSGKTMLARALPGLLPDLTPDQAIEVTAVHSLAGNPSGREPGSLAPPFRNPHHSVSRAGLVGGGSGTPRPGEISLAHHGLLFLDELCEFPRTLLEALRQPLEERRIVIARARGAVHLPAAFMFVAAANPCPCGYFGDAGRECICAPVALAAYRQRLSGPLRDRIDLIIDVPRQTSADLFDDAHAESTDAVRRRVTEARRRADHRGTHTAQLDGAALQRACALTPAAARLLALSGDRAKLSARGFFRLLRVARTVADLAGDERVGELAIAEALRYRGDGTALASAA